MADDLDLVLMEQLPKLKITSGRYWVTFLHHFDSLSLCYPLQASLLCGQYAHNTDVYSNKSKNADGTNSAYVAFQRFDDANQE